LLGVILVRWRMRPAAEVYGTTDWASRGEMQGGDISTDRKPF
jgi:hypothetical protein